MTNIEIKVHLSTLSWGCLPNRRNYKNLHLYLKFKKQQNYLVKYSDELATEDPIMNMDSVKIISDTVIIITDLLRSQ